MIWRSFGAGGWIHAMEFNHESKVYKLLVTHSTIIKTIKIIIYPDPMIAYTHRLSSVAIETCSWVISKRMLHVFRSYESATKYTTGCKRWVIDLVR